METPINVYSFWKRFKAEYLPAVLEKFKWYDHVDLIGVGDAVPIVDANIPESWQLGRINKTIPSKDRSTRQAEVKTANGILKEPTLK